MRLLLCALLLTGCAAVPMPRTSYHWTKAGWNAQTMDADWLSCVQANSAAAQVLDATAAVRVVHADAVDPDRAIDCMKARGYTLTGTTPG